MNSDIANGDLLAALGAVATLGAWAVYWRQIQRVRVPLRPIIHQSVMVVGIALAILAFLQGSSLFGRGVAVVSIIAGIAFLLGTLYSRTPKRRPAVAVIQMAPDFTAKDADGNDFTLSSLRGNPVLLKFFRGKW